MSDVKKGGVLTGEKLTLGICIIIVAVFIVYLIITFDELVVRWGFMHG